MDVDDHDSSAMHGLLPGAETVSPHGQDEQHASAPTGTGERLDLSLSVMCELARRLALGSEAREAKIRELQELIRYGAYHVTDDQIAGKMLRSLLRDDLT